MDSNGNPGFVTGGMPSPAEMTMGGLDSKISSLSPLNINDNPGSNKSTTTADSPMSGHRMKTEVRDIPHKIDEGHST